MRQLGHRPGDGPAGEPATEPNGAGHVVPAAVARADLHRTRQAVLGTDVHPEAAMFASSLACVVAAGSSALDPVPVRALLSGGDRQQIGGGSDWTQLGIPRSLPPLAGDGPGEVRPRPRPGGESAQRGGVRLPSAPAVVCDRSERIVRVNPAFVRLVGDGPELAGMRLPQLVVGPDSDAWLVRADASLVRVRVVRWEVPGAELSVIVLVELGETTAGAAGLGRNYDRTWTAELERIARVGTWSFELASGELHRSETLDELYQSVGLDPEADAGGPVEGRQVQLLCTDLRSGSGSADDHVELRLPGDVRLSCRAEVEYAVDGSPVRLIGVVRDVSSLDDGRVRHSGRRFTDLMQMTPGGVALLDPTGRVVDANPAMCDLLDVPLHRLRGVPAAALTAEMPLDGPADHRPDWLRPIALGAQFGYRVAAVPLRRADGSTVVCDLAVAATSVDDEDGADSADDDGWMWIVVCNDVSQRRRAEEMLRSAGTVDALTQLPNRRATLELIDRLLAGPSRERVAVVCGGFDDFQRVNSALGHDAGDELLVSIAGRLQRDLPAGCTAARLSGDEFVVICADHAEVGGPDQLARVVVELLRTTITVHGRPAQMTASVGIATPVPSEPRAADLLRFAEVAMLDAKRRQSRGGIGVATDGVVNSAAQALGIEAELQAAIEAGALVLDYQPVVGPDGTLRSAEALVRWPHPERGLIPPNDFLPVAQRSGLLRDLDIWVLRTAVGEASTWPEHNGKVPSVGVNLAGLLPGDPDFLTVVTDIVDGAGLPWHRLVLELVETSLVALPPHALAAMAQLVERGIRFAVDDFGTGYSSLARLKELPAQIVKVDRAFVTGIAEDSADFAVARAVVDMGRAMGRTTVAEGVETAEQFHVLRGIGVDLYQGWLFARPLAPSALREMIVKGRLPTPATRDPGL